MEDILQQIGEKLAPDMEKQLIVNKVLAEIEQETTEEIMLGGSFAKQTHIGDSFDCDIFIRFSQNGELSEKLEKIVQAVTKKLDTTYERVHGSRDYFQFTIDSITFELIPVLKITDVDEAENIMDYSPFHVSWVNKQLQENDYRNDIRIFKQFLKAQKIYGAESYIKGFSGHICDILIIYYGGFKETIIAISKWKTDKKTIIDIENFYKGKNVLFYMNESKAQSPLIIVDPIVKERNAAAALGESCYKKIIQAAKDFLKEPAKDFFTITPLSLEEVKARHSNKEIVSLEITPLSGKKDIIGSKMLKTIEYIITQVKDNGFSDVDFKWEWNNGNAKAFIIAKEAEVPKEYLQKGPEVTMSAAVAAFKEQHDEANIVEKEGRLFVKKRRQNTSLLGTIKTCFLDSYVTQRVKSIHLDTPN